MTGSSSGLSPVFKATPATPPTSYTRFDREFDGREFDHEFDREFDHEFPCII